MGCLALLVVPAPAALSDPEASTGRKVSSSLHSVRALSSLDGKYMLIVSHQVLVEETACEEKRGKEALLDQEAWTDQRAMLDQED
jgi:hypothetical protein